MAEAVLLSALLPVVFDKSADLIGEQLRKVLGADVKKEVKKLQSELSAVQDVLEDAEEKQLTNKPLRNWLAKLKVVAYEADDLLGDYLEVSRRREEDQERLMKKVRRFFSSDNPVMFRMRMACKIKEIVERFDSVAAERIKFHLIAEAGAMGRLPGTRDNRPQTQSYMLESEVIGREEDVKEIVELLIGQEHEKSISVLPIVGMGGLGKTTLAQLVYNHPRVREHFQPRIWVCVSENFDTKKIAKAVIESVTEKEYNISDMDPLLRRLREVIGGKRYLIVLDDVWNEEEQKWNALRVQLTSGGGGCTVIVTTRSDRVSSIVGMLDTYRLAHLPDDKCWDLFARLAFAGAVEEAPPNLVTMGKQIVHKCGRLPLAVTILGTLMRHTREESKWRLVMESEIWDLPVAQSGILPALRLSYNHLPAYLKQCFAFCAIFPKDYEMKELLIQLWMANGFIPSDAKNELELKAQEVFDELAQRSFLQDVKEVKSSYHVGVTTCRMHDLIHELARSIMGNECRVLDEGGDLYRNKDKSEGLANNLIRHLSLTDDDFSCLDGSHYPKTMQTLLLLNCELHTGSYPAKPCLRVLDLHKTKMSKLPISICNLRHLRYLDLSDNPIEILPEAICGLFNLQTLKLVGCRKLHELPKGMKMMSSLRHLSLYSCFSLRCMPAGMGQLRNLRTLTTYTAGDEDGSGSIGELKDLNLHGKLELRDLANARNVKEAKEANLGSKEKLQCLILRWGQPSSEGAKLSFLELLEIDSMPSVKHMGGTAFYGRGATGTGGTIFPSLREFSMNFMDDLEEWSGVEGSPSFPRLVNLLMWVCPKLRTMPRFPSVQDLEIGYCPLLQPTKGFFGCMASLKKLLIYSCDKLTLLLEQDENEAGRSSLRYLEIKRCHQQMFSSPSLGLWKHFSFLQELKMESCNGLISLPVEAVRGLSSIRTLQILSCPNLIGSSSSSSSSSSGAGGLQLQYLTALEVLVVKACEKLDCFAPDELQRLTALKQLTIHSCEGLVALPEFPESLQLVKIESCRNISSLAEGLGRLAALKSLEIIKLPELASLPKGLGRLTTLETLTITNLHSLRSLPEAMQGLSTLRRLTIKDLPSLTSLPEGMQLLDLAAT